jgi:DNA-binding transcriptional LysR family regulator
VEAAVLLGVQMGIAVVPRSVATHERPVELVPLRGRAPRWEVSLVARNGDTTSAAGRALAEMVPRAAFGSPRR